MWWNDEVKDAVMRKASWKVLLAASDEKMKEREKKRERLKGGYIGAKRK